MNCGTYLRSEDYGLKKRREDITRDYKDNLDFWNLHWVGQIYIQSRQRPGFIAQTRWWLCTGTAGTDFEAEASVALSFFDLRFPVNADEKPLDRLRLTVCPSKRFSSLLGALMSKKARQILGEFLQPTRHLPKWGQVILPGEVDGKVYKNSFISYENFCKITKMLK